MLASVVTSSVAAMQRRRQRKRRTRESSFESRLHGGGGGGGGGGSTTPSSLPASRLSRIAPRGWSGRSLLDFLNSLTFQTVVYFVFVIIFQSLSQTLRAPGEYYMTRRVFEDFVKEEFDASHNNFESVRRIADIYEWGNHVLFPSLFATTEPCNPSTVGKSGVAKGCNEHAWADGEGSFHRQNATAYTVVELVPLMDMLDWTDGVYLKQLRQRSQSCDGTHQLSHDQWSGSPTCLPEVARGSGAASSSTASFGYNHTDPSSPMLDPWTHFTPEQLGADRHGGITSASIPSMENYEADGFVAVILPFFSDTWLDEESGNVSQVADHRPYVAAATNTRTPRYFCVRLSRNGRHVRQLCDPTDNPVDKNGRLTGVVRAAIEEMWGDLKRGHFLDAQSRTLSVILQLRSNQQGIGYRISLLFELTSQGAVLPSYDVETRVLSPQALHEMRLFANLSLCLVVFFSLLELVEILQSSIAEYIADVWNAMDWVNYTFFLFVYRQVSLLQSALAEEDLDCASSYLCNEIGYFDQWRAMGANRALKQFLSLCLSVQLFKIIKFASQLIPKLGHMTFVLRKAIVDLAFFGLVFFISVASFSTMLFVQVGAFVQDFVTQIASIMSLIRALFGDFDIAVIMDNSSGYVNALFLLVYLFVAIFIMLTLFISILAEGHTAVREHDMQLKEDDPEYNEYGQLANAAHMEAISEVEALHRRIESLGANVGMQLNDIDAKLEKRERRMAKLREMDGQAGGAAVGGGQPSLPIQKSKPRRPRPTAGLV